MGELTTSSIVSALRRGLSAMLCVFLLVATVVPSADAFVIHAPVTAAAVVAPSGGDDGEPAGREALPCHAAHHCGCKIPGVAPVLTEADPPIRTIGEGFVAVASAALVSRVQVPPVEPPRT